MTKEVLSLLPNCARAKSLSAQVLEKKSQIAKAKETFLEALQMDPGSNQILFAFADFYTNQGETGSAIEM